jgi:hypothetical protein
VCSAEVIVLSFPICIVFSSFFADVNAFRRISEDVSAELKEFSLGVASIADSFGIALASVVAIGIESGLRHFRDDKGLPCHGGISE